VTGAPQPSDHLWWLVSRASGLVALALVTLSVLLGLAMAGRLRRGPDAAGIRITHEHLAIAALVAIGIHGVSLLGDPWLHPGLSGISVPFALGFRPVYTGLGVIAGYLTALLALSFYIRRRIGVRTWRRLHRFTIGAYALAVVHALGAGTDASLPAVRWAVLSSAAVVGVLFAYRMAAARRSGAPARVPAGTYS
jgi:methionine sulfoxide reductase heme-binding subunit